MCWICTRRQNVQSQLAAIFYLRNNLVHAKICWQSSKLKEHYRELSKVKDPQYHMMFLIIFVQFCLYFCYTGSAWTF